MRPEPADLTLSEPAVRAALDRIWPPPPAGQPVLLHGDYWPGNTLWRDGALVCVLDWEDAALGDPVADLANARMELTMVFGAAAADGFTRQYAGLRPELDLCALPHWDLYAALRHAGRMPGWGLPAAELTRLQNGHREFTAAALAAAPVSRGQEAAEPRLRDRCGGTGPGPAECPCSPITTAPRRKEVVIPPDSASEAGPWAPGRRYRCLPGGCWICRRRSPGPTQDASSATSALTSCASTGPRTDVTELFGTVIDGRSGMYAQMNAGKRNIAVNLAVDGGSDLILELAARADVVIENFRPGVIDRLGLGYERLAAVNPGLIMLSISGFGRTGPDAGRRALAPVIHAESGLLARQADLDGREPADLPLAAGRHGDRPARGRRRPRGAAPAGRHRYRAAHPAEHAGSRCGQRRPCARGDRREQRAVRLARHDLAGARRPDPDRRTAEARLGHAVPAGPGRRSGAAGQRSRGQGAAAAAGDPGLDDRICQPRGPDRRT